jgi:hypothetical protein
MRTRIPLFSAKAISVNEKQPYGGESTEKFFVRRFTGTDEKQNRRDIAVATVP